MRRFPDRLVPDGALLTLPDVNREANPHLAKQHAELVERHKPTPIQKTDVVEAIGDFSLLAPANPGDVKRLDLTDLTVHAGDRFHRWSPIVQIPGVDHLFRQVER